jgi:dTMP kinase
LADGKIVICDRFVDSSLAYQGCDLGIDYVIDIHRALFGNNMPDITFLIDVPAKVGLDRAKARGNNNRFEFMPMEFHEKIRSKFLTIQNKFSDRIVRIDGNRSKDEIFEEIIARVTK